MKYYKYNHNKLGKRETTIYKLKPELLDCSMS